MMRAGGFSPEQGIPQTGLDDEQDTNQKMRTATGGAHLSAPITEALPSARDSDGVLKRILAWLDEAKAEEVVTVDLNGKSSIGDYMVIATGRSDRHVGAIGDQLQRKLKEEGHGRVRVEGMPQCDWVLVDTGDVIVHLFRSEVRSFYNLEKMWSADRTQDVTAH